MKNFVKILILLNASLLLESCFNNDEVPDASLTIFDDKITCEYCYGDFGEIIEANGDELVITEGNTILIFKWENQDLIQTQTIDYGNTGSGINCVIFRDENLFIGHADTYGTGIVSIYQKGSDNWELIQELTIGREQDNFGNSIDLSNEYLVIGANAPWIDDIQDWQNKDEGRIYIYHKTSSDWSFYKEFKSQNSFGGDWFGSSIAIQGNYVLAGSSSTSLHIYENDGEWKFLRTEPIRTSKIVHYENNFLARNDASYENMLLAFTIDENANFEYSDFSFDFTNKELSGHGEILDINETNSIFSLETDNYCFTMEYQNSTWDNITEVNPAGNECWVMLGIEITEDKIYMGGESIEEGWKDIVYILDY
jgi:hypothetical protein